MAAIRSFAVTVFVFVVVACPAQAWNALGHKVACEIAWQQLDGSQRKDIVDILRRHPRFEQDFDKRLDTQATDEEIFLHSGTWPNIARGIQGPERKKFDKSPCIRFFAPIDKFLPYYHTWYFTAINGKL